jgi:hypothetical protein
MGSVASRMKHRIEDNGKLKGLVEEVERQLSMSQEQT